MPEPETPAETPATETPAPEGEQPAEETTPPAEAETPPEDKQEAEEIDEEKEGGLDLPSAREALSKVRKSEAAMRTRLREIEAKLEGALTPEQVTALRDEIASDNAKATRDLLVENVAVKAGLPPELADALKGDTREELEAHAKTLAKFAPSTPVNDPDLSGGLTPGDGGGSFDEDAARAAVRAARRGY